MSVLDRDRFHRAARDGYLDLLREATRKDCNAPDEDGMTPTLWAAYIGNLDALRMLVGRGGDPDKCDHYGNTALHCAATNGHMNCVSFLVSFGANLWALDNDFHTVKDVSAIHQRDEILKYMDQVIARQSALNKKLVQKLKEKSLKDAEKRVKQYSKLQKKANKKAEKDDKHLEKLRKKLMAESGQGQQTGKSVSTLRKDSRLLYASPTFSDIVSNTTAAPKKGLGAVSKRVQSKKHETRVSDFKVREVESDGKKSVRSLSGLRRDSEVLYVPKYEPGGRRHMRDVFGNGLPRAISEPDFMHEVDDMSGAPPSIFERPGFGSMAFRNSITTTLMSLPSLSTENDSEDSESRDVSTKNGSVEDSIGSAGSLQKRSNELPWDEEDLGMDDEDGGSDSSPVILFLAAHGLTEYIPLFTKERIDIESLVLLNEEDLRSLGLPMGPRRKLIKAVEQRKAALQEPGEVADSKL